MRVYHILFTLIALLMLSGAGSAALVPDQNSTIATTAPNNWIVVFQQATIVVYSYNSTGLTPVPGANVTWGLNTTTLGSLSSASSTTDSQGEANVTFTAGRTSGSVLITATISANSNTIQKTCVLNIDHDIPYYAAFNYQTEVTVATVTPFNVTFTDKWGNPIDRRNPYNPQYINLLMGTSPTNTAAFNVNGTLSQYLSLQPDQNGSISLGVLTDQAAGENIIALYFSNCWSNGDQINGQHIDYEYIISVTNGVPFSISQAVTPSDPAALPADGASNHVFTFIYSLQDRFGNVAANQTVRVHTDFGDADQYLVTGNDGTISFNYGPHTTAGNVTITTTSVSNATVSCNFTIDYYSTAAVSMAFSADPSNMPSIDANASSTSQLRAKIMDIMGNPVSGQTVNFGIGTPSYDTPYVSSVPHLINTTAVSDSNGYATVTFVPGGFNTTNNIYGLFNPAATGSVTATASWNGLSQQVPLVWKNYPYLKITEAISPTVIPVNGTFNVTITMVGDGWKLNGKPADVVIVTDLAGGVGGSTLLGYTKAADTAFVKNATNTTWVALASFGDVPSAYSTNASLLYANQTKPGVANNFSLFNPYGSVKDWCLVKPSSWDTSQSPQTIINTPISVIGGVPGHAAHYQWTTSTGYNYFNSYSDASIDHTFVDHQAELSTGKPLQTTIAGYNGVGGTDYAAGINAALKLFAQNPNPLHSQSIVIMGDGIPMMAPLSPGSLESYWPSDWYPRSSLGWEDESDTAIAAAVDSATRAKAQGITIYAAAYPLNNQIDSATLQQLVSSPTDYHQGSIDSLTAIMLAIQGQIQQNAGVNTTMTLNFNNATVGYGNNNLSVAYVYNPPSSTSTTWQDGTTNVTDQSAQWTSSHELTWNVGTITLGQTWQTTFQMQAKQQGIFNIFGNQSQAIFNDGADYENITNGTITIVNNETNTGVSQLQINITDFRVTQAAPFTTTLPLEWNITYPGNYTAQEILWYSTDNNHWTAGPVWTISKTTGNLTEIHNVDISGLASGTYYFMLQGDAPDANCNSVLCPAELSTPIGLGSAGQKAYIKLQ